MDDVRALSIETLLRRLAAARRAGAPERARAERDALLARALPRTEAAVKAFRFPGRPDVRIPPHEQGAVRNDAVLRAMRMLETLRGTSEGEYLAAVTTCARHTCMDFCRRELAVERRLAGRLEEREGEAPDPQLQRVAERRSSDAEAAREAADWLERALAALPPNQRRVVELTRDGWPVPEIAAALQTSGANVHQLRSRAFKLLRKEEHP